MTKANKVLWQDGMFIYPHHFQQQDYYFENLLNNYQILQPYPHWGILTLEIDESYFNLNKILLRKCSGILPNGMFFDIPNRDNFPIAIELPKGYNNKPVYLGIPINNKQMLSPVTKEKPGSRYYGEEEELTDNSSGNLDQQTIAVSKLNFNFFLEGEDVDQIIRLPIIKIISTDDGIKPDINYIPPCLRLHSSNVILGCINEIIGLLTNYLSIYPTIAGVAETSENQVYKIENLLILQTVSKYKALFDLMLQNKFHAPYNFFEQAVCLISSLAIFTKETPEDLNLNYDHSALTEAFTALVKKTNSVFRVLGKNISFKYELNSRGNGIYTSELKQISSFQDVELIVGLEVKNNLIETDKIINSIKIASMNDIDNIIHLKVAGINYKVLTITPSYILNQQDTIYLKIEKTGELWNQLTIHKNFAVYLGQKVNEVNKIKLWINPL